MLSLRTTAIFLVFYPELFVMVGYLCALEGGSRAGAKNRKKIFICPQCKMKHT